MGDIGSAVKYLYDKFILRDVLSFVTPGAVVAYVATRLFFPEIFFLYTPWPFYIPIFGFCFVIGFAIQCSGEMFGFLHYYRDPHSSFNERCKIWGLKWYKLPNEIGFKNKMKELQDYRSATKCDDEAKQKHERFVILKQMCVNNFIAILIAIILFLIDKYLSEWWVLIVAIPLVSSLFWGYRVHILRQDAWEQAAIELVKDSKPT